MHSCHAVLALSIPGLTTTALAQTWPLPAFDAPLVVLSNNSYSMVELLDSNGDGVLEALGLRVDGIGGPAFVSVNTAGLGVPIGALSRSGTMATISSSLPFTAVGRIGPADPFDDAVLGLGQGVWVLKGANAMPVPPDITLPTIGYAQGVAIGDFDNDGLGDVATLTTFELAVYRALTATTFAPVTLPLPSGGERHLLRAEINGDGVPDLVVVTGANADFYRIAGPGLVASGSMPIGVVMPMPAAGDIDSDGDEDIVVFDEHDYVVLRRTGPAAFVREAPVTGGPATHLIDVDGDGDLDGACCGGGGGPPGHLYTPMTFRVSINTGGVFAPAWELPGIGGWHLAGIADIDGDGWRDLVSGRAIYFARQSLAIPPHRAGPGGTLSPNCVADLDRDGDPDWLSGLAVVHRNRGDGSAAVASLPLFTPPAAGTAYAEPVIPGDFDGDGDTDLIVEVRAGATPIGTRLLLQRGGTFADGGTPLPAAVMLSPWLGTDSGRMLVTDFDGDGDLDMIGRAPAAPWWSHLWRNDGTGSFTFADALVGECVVAVRDFTRDGRQDLVVADGRLRLRRGLSGGGFAPGEDLTAASWPYFNVSTAFHPGRDSIACADFDGDGNLDIVAGERSATGGCFPVLLRGRAAAVPPFVPGGGPGGLNGVNPQEGVRMFAGDLDRDGNPDLVLSDPFNAQVLGAGVAFGTGTQSAFDTLRTQQLLVPVHALADFDGDGDLDAFGPEIAVNRWRDGTAAGSRVQWGTGTAGTAGVVPLLGATGPIRIGEPLTFHVSGGVGQGCGLLVIGWTARALPLFGGTSYVEPQAAWFFCTQGAAGVGGDGHWSLPVARPQPSLAGSTFILQAGVFDAVPAAGIALSNALTVAIGG